MESLGVGHSSASGQALHACHITTVHAWNDVRIFQRMCCGLAEKGVRVTLFAPIAEESLHQNVRVLPTGLRGRLARLLGAPTLFRKLWKVHADIYHFHDPELLPWMFLFQWLTPSKAVVYDVHEYCPESLILGNFFGHPLLNRLMSRVVLVLEPRLGRRLRGVIGVTEPIAARFRGGRARVEVVRNVVKLASIQPVTQVASETQEPLLVLGGSIARDRCMEELIQAIGILKKRGVTLHLHCLGKPHPAELGTALQAQSRRLGIEQQIVFRDKMPFDEYQRYLSRSRIGLVLYAPGLNNTMGVPNRLYEFMAQSLPVVASDFPEVARVVRDANCGLLVNSSDPERLADGIEFLITRPEEACQMGENGRRAVEDRYCWERELPVLLRFYQRLTSSGPA